MQELIQQSETDLANWQSWANAVENFDHLKNEMIKKLLEYDKMKRLHSLGFKSKADIIAFKNDWIKSVNRYVRFKTNNPGVIV